MNWKKMILCDEYYVSEGHGFIIDTDSEDDAIEIQKELEKIKEKLKKS